MAVVAAAAGLALAFGVFDRSGVAGFGFDHPRAVPTMLGGLLLVGAAVLTSLHARSQPAGTARRQWRSATVLLAILAGEQLLSLRGWIHEWAGGPVDLAYSLALVACALAALATVAVRLHDRPVSVGLWAVGAIAWIGVNLPGALAPSGPGGPMLAGSVELASIVLLTGALVCALPADRKPWRLIGVGAAAMRGANALAQRTDPLRLGLALFGLIAAFTVLGAFAHVHDVRRESAPNPLHLFHLNDKLTYPAYYLALLLLAAACLALLLAHRRAGGRPLPWLIVGLVLIAGSATAVLSIHERFQDRVGAEALVLLSPAILAGAVAGLVTVRRVWSDRLVRSLYVGGGLLWSSAFVVDVFRKGNPFPEEQLEKAGSALILLALLIALQRIPDPAAGCQPGKRASRKGSPSLRTSSA